ncbi:MAG: hypothetical protein DRG30_05295 [Epsilonproteobacteria bacterium]|nr:MAG: hypothetical protein DRG30_05295 [Campylobacterota bacterium]
MNKNTYIKRVGTVIIVMVSLSPFAEAYIKFMPHEQLVKASEYIVVSKVQTVSDTGKTMRWREATAKVVKNELQVIESIKGSLKKPFVLNTLKFDGWMEDNVKLPRKGLDVLLFLKRDKKGELKPVNGIQGVWRIGSDGKPIYGTMKEIREIVKSQTDSCSSEAFVSLVDTAEIQTEVGHYKEALNLYRKSYRICPMKDLEEQMVWLMGEVGDEEFVQNSK